MKNLYIRIPFKVKTYCGSVSKVLLMYAMLFSFWGCNLVDNRIGGELFTPSLVDPSLVQIYFAAEEFTETDLNLVYDKALKVSIPHATSVDIVVHFVVQDGYAVQGNDFTVSVQNLVIPAGATESFIPIEIIGDTIGEGEEGFDVRLTTTNFGTIISLTTQIKIKDNDPIILEVKPVYPVNGSKWNDYIAFDSTLQPNKQLDTPCVIISDCLHGAEIQEVEAIGEYSCEQLTMSDSLGVFSWTCDGSFQPVKFFSQGLIWSKGLIDLVDPIAFKANRVILNKTGSKIAESLASTTWWSNTVLSLPDNSMNGSAALDLATESNIYTIETPRASSGVTISAQKVSLIVMPGANFSPNGTLTNDCAPTSGGVESCLLLLYNNYLWIEGDFVGGAMITDFKAGVITENRGASSRHYYITLRNINIDASTAAYGMYMDRGDFFSFRNIFITGATNSGINIYGVRQSIFDNINITNSLFAHGLRGDNLVQSNTFTNITVSNNNQDGVNVAGADHTFYNIRSYNNRVNGLYSSDIGAGVGFRFSRILSFNNGASGMTVSFSGTTSSLVTSSTLANNGSSGLNLPQMSTAFLTSLLVKNNATNGILLGGDTNVFHNTYISGNGTGINLNPNSDENAWSGQLFLNNTTDCSTNGVGALPGLAGANCDIIGNSTAQRTLGVNDLNITLSPTPDIVNLHNTASLLYDSITDWTNFTSGLRGWGKNTAGFCGTGENCNLIDWTLAETASDLLGVNGFFVPDAACPISVDGGTNFSSVAAGTSYLYHAEEILYDFIGNEDGFCNSNEACIFMPNISYYQGSKQLTATTCVFSDGLTPASIVGVKMYGRE